MIRMKNENREDTIRADASVQESRALRGLTREQVELSRKRHGSNRLSERPTRGFFSRFLSNLNDPVIRVLLVALGLAMEHLLLIWCLGDYGDEPLFPDLSCVLCVNWVGLTSLWTGFYQGLFC